MIENLFTDEFSIGDEINNDTTELDSDAFNDNDFMSPDTDYCDNINTDDDSVFENINIGSNDIFHGAAIPFKDKALNFAEKVAVNQAVQRVSSMFDNILPKKQDVQKKNMGFKVKEIF